jgi:ketosteroid isomerase-like protein
MLSTAMSRNAEVLVAGYEAWNQDDLDAWLELLHPDIELRTSGIFPGFDPVYRGHNGLARYWRQQREAWEVFQLDIEAIEERGDRFALSVRFRAKGVGSGAELDMRFGHAIRMRDGLAVEIVAKVSADEAREALSEPSRERASH